MIEPTPQLDAFDIGDCIGQGAMGKVFRAIHATTGVPVAIKGILGCVDDKSKRAFHREVQAQAGLVHPGVVYLFDYGVLDDDAPRVFDEKLSTGSPYVAMELADRGTLSDHMPLEDWPTVRALLLQVLDALAFSHAREVIHRDLKPQNLLMCTTDQGGLQVKLADFGLAYAIEQSVDRSEQSLARISGTPYYMAPEQLHGTWRTYGPWTDIYALGCVAWHLVCGRPPYTGDTLLSIAIKHLSDELPGLEPIFDIPDEVQTWIHRAIAVEPEDRFQRAADAARALPTGADITSGHDFDGHKTKGIDAPAPTLPEPIAKTWETTLKWRGDDRDGATTNKIDRPPLGLASTVDANAESSKSTLPSATPTDAKTGPISTAVEDRRTPIPDTWHTERTDRLPTPLIGTGLGLFGLREVPFVDRNPARDQIWQALQEVAERNELRAVFICGEAGVGKSRLAHWMATRAHEVGAISVLKAVHTGGGQGPTEGFSGLIQRAFHTWKLSRRELYQELLEQLPPLDENNSFLEIDARALTEFVHPTTQTSDKEVGPRYQFSSARQKHALLSRLLMRVSKDRVPLLWLDDLQYSSEALGLVDYLLSLSDDHCPPALIVGTLRSDILVDNEQLAQKVVDLVDDSRCYRIDLGAIDTSDHRELIDRMLPLSPELADTLARRTEGNPLFAHQLLSHWLDAENVELSDQGFRVIDDQGLSIPDDIHALWIERVQRLLQDFGTDHFSPVEEILELAAALGREVDHSEWRALCSIAGFTVPAGLDDALIEPGLAERTEDGWAFAHGLFVDSLERHAKEHNRWQKHHSHCAQMLEINYPEQPGQTAWRRAQHLIKAGKLEQALSPLLQANKRWYELGEMTQFEQSLHLHRDVLDRLDREELAMERLENDLLHNKLLTFDGDLAAAIAGAREILRKCLRIDDDMLAWRAHEQLAHFLIKTGELEGAHRQLGMALDLAVAADDEYWQGKVMYRQAEAWFALGELEKAARCNRQARTHFRNSHSLYDKLLCDVQRGWILLSREHYQQGRKTLQSVLDQASRQGFRYIERDCLHGLGDLARYSGRLAQARRHYEQSHHIDRELGADQNAIVPILNIAQAELALGHFQRGRELLKRLRSKTGEIEDQKYREFFDCMALVLESGQGDWSKVDLILDKYKEGWPEMRPVYKDNAWLLELAAEHAEKAEQIDCAQRLWRLAAGLWKKLGDDEASARATEACRD